MDGEILRALNSVATNEYVSAWLYFVTRDPVKNFLPIILIWGVWFSGVKGERDHTREKVVTTILLSFVAIAVGRVLASVLPHRTRPIFDQQSGVIPLDWVDLSLLDGWSAFPSDHAILFVALGVGLFLANRIAGTIALFHAAIIVCLPRIAVGWHWPTDIFAGAAIGVILVLVLYTPVSALVRRTSIIPFFLKREYIGYPILFLVTFEMSIMFSNVRQLVSMI